MAFWRSKTRVVRKMRMWLAENTEGHRSLVPKLSSKLEKLLRNSVNSARK